MTDAIANAMHEFFSRVRVADLLDVLLVSALIYAALGWLRGGASRTVVVITSMAVGLLILARVMSLYLTQMVIRSLLTVFIISFVVLFRDELRRELDRLTARGRFRRRRQHDAMTHLADTLVTASARMARERVGALIFLAGHEDWQRSVTGGVPLDGEVSEPLLYSLFNPDSPGHDGALLIEHGRITRFGAHLPLSTNLAQVGPRGTRHAAALGMAEQCDGLVIVVSEERGEVSVARAGRLETLASPFELKEHLDRFRRQELSDPTANKSPAWRWQDVGAAALSLAIATTLWAVFAYQSATVFRTFDLPIEFRNPPERFTITDAGPTEARVVIGGPSPAFRQLEPDELTLQVDLSGIDAGHNQVPLTDESLELPSDLRLYSIDPPDVQLTARPAGGVEGSPGAPGAGPGAP